MDKKFRKSLFLPIVEVDRIFLSGGHMVKLRFLGGIIFSSWLMILAVYMGPNSRVFLSLPDLILGLMVPMGLMYAKFGTIAFRISGLSPTKKNEIIKQWDQVLLLVATGVIVMNLIQMLYSETFQNFNSIGPGLGGALLVFFQAYFIKIFILFPLRSSEVANS
jgi:hypothetical protein